MRTNRTFSSPPIFTHEGGKALHISPLKELRRSALSTLLFEDEFYEGGESIAKRVQALVKEVPPEKVAALAVEAREKMYLRHLPLFLVRELARVKGNGPLVRKTLSQVIQRPDELTEYLALYWKGQKDADKEPLSAASKKGLADALEKFSSETLSKYDLSHEYKIRDVLRLTHPRPSGKEKAEVYAHLLKRDLPPPDTWEVALSAGGEKREVFERLLRERKLGGLAFLRNLRNMIEAKVDPSLIRERFEGDFRRVFPYRFISALRYAPQFVKELDSAMMRQVKDLPKLRGTTGVLIDVSGSMDNRMSGRSEMLRWETAAGLAVLVAGLADHARIFTFSKSLVEVPAFAGMGLIDAIKNSQFHQDTLLRAAVAGLEGEALDRLIIITDEQSNDGAPSLPKGMKGYLINVASYRNGVAYGPWTHLDGFSERVLEFIQALEEEEGGE